MSLYKERFLKYWLIALLLCAAAFRSSALTNVVVNGSMDGGYGGWTPGGSLEVTGGYVIFGTSFSQDLNTVPGRDYIVRFAVKYSMPRLRWGTQVYDTFTNWPSASSWQSVYRFVHATSSVTRLSFESVTGNVGLDDVVVGWLREPASIVTQPQSRSAVEGGSVAFTIQADGGPPIFYQWFRDGEPLPGATNNYIVRGNLTASDNAAYHVVLSNIVNATTSTVATLTVDSSPKEPQIVLQPEGQDIAAGYAYTLRAAAIGSLPLSYQWFFNEEEISGATNPALPFAAADLTNSGVYTIKVSNHQGSTLSLPATLNVSTVTNPGGYINVNTTMPLQTQIPVFDVDGYTRVTRSNYVAQVYVGSSPTILRAAGPVLQFSPQFPGCLASPSIQVPDVPPGNLVYGQLRVWDPLWGSSYEEARARGGKFGFSSVVSVASRPPLSTPGKLPITSFSLRFGLPEFTSGKLESGNRLLGGAIEWVLTGEPGFRYLIEKRLPPQNWEPLTVLTNDTGRVTFTDPDQQNSSLKFYRSRMLE